jgi:quinol monooxygenase YgiN
VAERGTFFLYEQYTSEQAFREHAASAHVRDIVLDDAVARLAVRQREFFETL